MYTGDMYMFIRQLHLNKAGGKKNGMSYSIKSKEVATKLPV